MNNYNITNLPSTEYNLKGLKLYNGVTCVFWTKKNVQKINEVIVLLNNKSVIAVNNNQICISLNGVNDINDQKECLKAFAIELKKMNLDVKRIRFRFVVADKNEEKIVNGIIKDLGINGSVLNFDENNKRTDENNKKKDKVNEVEEKIKNNYERDGKSNVVNITKYDNNTRKDIVYDKDNNVAYDLSKETLSMSELMKIEYEKLMKDPIESEKLFNMTDEEVLRYVAKIVNNNRKEHFMEMSASNNRDNMTKKEKATATIAAKQDGLSNNELGIVKNNPNNRNEITAIQERNDNLEEVNPETSNIGFNSSSNTNVTNNNYFSDNDINDKEEKRKEEINEDISYYVDNDGKVYNGNTGEVEPGLYCNENNEIIDKNKKVVGYNCGTYDDMLANMNKSNDFKRAKTLIYKKPLVDRDDEDFYDDEKSAAFISIPVIIFIVSLLLLIGSGVIWYITK